MIAYCGLKCLECPTYLATQNDDQPLREKTAAEWSKMFGTLKPSEMVCDGCLKDDGRLFGFCTECEVRACVREKGMNTCAECSDYPCSKLEPLFKLDAEIKTALDTIRAQL